MTRWLWCLLLMSGCASCPQTWNHYRLEEPVSSGKDFRVGAEIFVNYRLQLHRLIYHEGCLDRWDMGREILVCPSTVHNVPGELLLTTTRNPHRYP